MAVSDELRLTVRPLPFIERSSWKRTIKTISQLCTELDVRTVVIGLPLRLDGTEGDAAEEVRRIARNMHATLKIPVEVQDERLTSKEAENLLREKGHDLKAILEHSDSESATLILRDFIQNMNVGKLT